MGKISGIAREICNEQTAVMSKKQRIKEITRTTNNKHLAFCAYSSDGTDFENVTDDAFGTYGTWCEIGVDGGYIVDDLSYKASVACADSADRTNVVTAHGVEKRLPLFLIWAHDENIETFIVGTGLPKAMSVFKVETGPRRSEGNLCWPSGYRGVQKLRNCPQRQEWRQLRQPSHNHKMTNQKKKVDNADFSVFENCADCNNSRDVEKSLIHGNEVCSLAHGNIAGTVAHANSSNSANETSLDHTADDAH